jgi:hypothetical protein
MCRWGRSGYTRYVYGVASLGTCFGGAMSDIAQRPLTDNLWGGLWALPEGSMEKCKSSCNPLCVKEFGETSDFGPSLGNALRTNDFESFHSTVEQYLGLYGKVVKAVSTAWCELINGACLAMESA